MANHVRDAAQRNLPPCPKCGALKGDPCRAPSNKPCAPHQEREALLEQEENDAIDDLFDRTDWPTVEPHFGNDPLPDEDW